MGLCIRWPSSKLKLLNYKKQIQSLANVGGLRKHVSGKEDHLMYKKQNIYRTRKTLSCKYDKKRVKMVVV